MKAIVLCAGKGTRMRPYSYYIHKTMMPLSNGKPLIQHIVDYLQNYHFEVIIAVSQENNYQQLLHLFRNQNVAFSVKMHASETAGEVHGVEELLEDEEDFLVYYGDTLSDVNLEKMYQFHKRHGYLVTLCGVKGLKIESGILNGNKTVTSLSEKPVLPYYVNCPIFFCNKKILSHLSYGVDFMKDVFPKLLKEKKKIGLYKHKGLYIDLGNIAAYEKALEVKVKL